MNGSTFSQYRAGVSVTYSVDVRTVWCCNSPCDMSSGKKRTTKQLYFASSNTSKQKVQLQLPQQAIEANSAARVTSGSNVHSVKKVKLDSNGLNAVEHSNNATAAQPAHPQLHPQLQSPAAMLSADAAQLQQQGLPASRLAPPAAEVLGAAQHQQQRPPPSCPQAPPTEVLGSLMLQVQKDRRPVSPLLQSAARGVPPPPHYQPCVDRAPLRVPRLAAAPDCGNTNWTPYKAAPSTRRMSSGQRVGTCMQHLLQFASAACKSSICMAT